MAMLFGEFQCKKLSDTKLDRSARDCRNGRCGGLGPSGPFGARQVATENDPATHLSRNSKLINHAQHVSSAPFADQPIPTRLS